MIILNKINVKKKIKYNDKRVNYDKTRRVYSMLKYKYFKMMILIVITCVEIVNGYNIPLYILVYVDISHYRLVDVK